MKSVKSQIPSAGALRGSWGRASYQVHVARQQRGVERCQTFRDNLGNSPEFLTKVVAMKMCLWKSYERLRRELKTVEDRYNQIQSDTGPLRGDEMNLFVALDSRSNVYRTFRCLWARELESMTQHDPRELKYNLCRSAAWFPPKTGLVKNMKREDPRSTQRFEWEMMRNDENITRLTRNQRNSATVKEALKYAQILFILFKWWFLPALPALRIGSNYRVLIGDISTCSWSHYTHSSRSVREPSFGVSLGGRQVRFLRHRMRFIDHSCATWCKLCICGAFLPDTSCLFRDLWGSFGFLMSFDVLWCPYGNSEYLWIMETQWRPSGVLVRLGGAGVLMMTRSHKTHIETSQPLHISRFL